MQRRQRHRQLVQPRLRPGRRRQPSREPVRGLRPEPRPDGQSTATASATGRGWSPAAVAAFASVGWGWGGAWTGNTKDYMHFSDNGH